MISSLRLIVDPTLYRSVVGALQYVTLTHPQLSFSVNKVCQFMNNTQLTHWKEVKRILWYLAGTTTQGLHLYPSPSYSVVSFSDSDWATDLDDRKFISGYCIYVDRNLISWSSKKQNVFSRSSTEAEYGSVVAALMNIIWIKSLMDELCLTTPTPRLYSDNMEVVQLVTNPVMHS